MRWQAANSSTKSSACSAPCTQTRSSARRVGETETGRSPASRLRLSGPSDPSPSPGERDVDRRFPMPQLPIRREMKGRPAPAQMRPAADHCAGDRWAPGWTAQVSGLALRPPGRGENGPVWAGRRLCTSPSQRRPACGYPPTTTRQGNRGFRARTPPHARVQPLPQHPAALGFLTARGSLKRARAGVASVPPKQALAQWKYASESRRWRAGRRRLAGDRPPPLSRDGRIRTAGLLLPKQAR